MLSNNLKGTPATTILRVYMQAHRNMAPQCSYRKEAVTITRASLCGCTPMDGQVPITIKRNSRKTLREGILGRNHMEGYRHWPESICEKNKSG